MKVWPGIQEFRYLTLVCGNVAGDTCVEACWQWVCVWPGLFCGQCRLAQVYLSAGQLCGSAGHWRHFLIVSKTWHQLNVWITALYRKRHLSITMTMIFAEQLIWNRIYTVSDWCWILYHGQERHDPSPEFKDILTKGWGNILLTLYRFSVWSTIMPVYLPDICLVLQALVMSL